MRLPVQPTANQVLPTMLPKKRCPCRFLAQTFEQNVSIGESASAAIAVGALQSSLCTARQNTERGDRQPIAIQGERRLLQWQCS